ncbi:MAG: NAD(P)/FAD-dependent oxidoreductase [Burkholderiaceae bacterium]
MTESVDCVVVGAGVVGLAVARALAQARREVIVLEAASSIGTGISSRNSEVIHAGLYYPPHSLKAALCVRGASLLYDYCAAHHVAHERLGKLVIATAADQLPTLRALLENAVRSGATELVWLEPAAVGELEPELRCAGAILSPRSGIVDSHGLMLALQADAEAAGAVLAFQSPLAAGAVKHGGILLSVGGKEPSEIMAREVINCAGLGAQALARSLHGLPRQSIPDEAYAKGSYFALSGKCPFHHLVYPVPEPGGLGVHLTLDLAGRAKFGPDVEWVAEPDYRVEVTRSARFEEAIRHYWPGLPADVLVPDYAGVRPKLKRAGSGFSDFILSGPREHGVRGIFNLFAIESPGLTASLALAEKVVEEVCLAGS